MSVQVGANTPVNTEITRGGASGAGGLLSAEKDAKEASTAPKFGEIFQNTQAKYGAKPEKPKEIKKTLGKDDFLKIMITQMRNQDPTSPFKAEQMAEQMAQFTSVEQLQNINQNLNKMQSQSSATDRLAMTNLIGKTVTIDRDRFPHIEGQNEILTFNLPREAEEVLVTVVNENGETVAEKKMGKQKAGEGEFIWDGKKLNTLPAKAGNYMLRVDAKDARGQAIQTSSQGQARVIGVSFEGSEPVFLVGDNRRQEKISMKNVIRIEDSGSGGARPSSSVQQGPPKPEDQAALPGGEGIVEAPSKMIAFEKGVGSRNFDTTAAPPEALNAIRKFQEEQAKSVAQASPAAPSVPSEEKGFPNGLQDSEDVHNITKKGGGR